MANLVQRGLRNLNQTARAVRTGEGDSGAAKLGRAGKKSLKKAKGKLDDLKASLGLGGVDIDAYEEEPDEQRQRRRSRQLIGEEETVFVAKDGSETRDLAATVAPEFRAQVAQGLAAANSFTLGSTLADAPGGEPDPNEGW